MLYTGKLLNLLNARCSSALECKESKPDKKESTLRTRGCEHLCKPCGKKVCREREKAPGIPSTTNHNYERFVMEHKQKSLPLRYCFRTVATEQRNRLAPWTSHARRDRLVNANYTTPGTHWRRLAAASVPWMTLYSRNRTEQLSDPVLGT